MKNCKEILLFLFFINFIKSSEYFSISDEKTESKSFMHNYYVKLLMNNTIIKLKPTFNSYYVLINSSSYDFLNSSTYRKLNNEKKKLIFQIIYFMDMNQQNSLKYTNMAQHIVLILIFHFY